MKAARFEFQECESGFQNANGTKVFTEDGEIHGIVGATIHVEAGDLVRAEVRLMPVMDKIEGAETHFVMEHPLKGGFEEVGKIVFADGSEVDFGDVEREPVDPEEIETVTFKSAAREFVFGIKQPPPPPSPPPPRSVKGDSPHAESFRRIIRNIFDISERKRWTGAISRAWFALKA